MYHGPVTRLRNEYVLSGYVSVPIPVHREFHAYQCEACGRLWEVLGKADEPFYCRCNHLISLNPSGDSQCLSLPRS